MPQRMHSATHHNSERSTEREIDRQNQTPISQVDAPSVDLIHNERGQSVGMIGGKLSYGPAAKEPLLEVMRMLVVVLVVNAGVPFPENKGKPQ